METNYDELLYREKFAVLIARLHDLGFTDDIITQKIISHRYFNLFEENNHFAFINKSIEEIIAEVFNKQNVVINYNKYFTTEYYWAGLMYFNIMYHCHTPLERVFLIWPLSKMISKFNPYHEMPENALYDNYLEEEKKIGIIKQLKALTKLSSRKVSVLTDINENTINTYYNNEKLFSASYENIDFLSRAFNVKPQIFKRRSSFVIITDVLMADKEFKDRIIKALINYFDISKDILVVTEYKDTKELQKLGRQHKEFIYLPDFAFVKYRGRLDYAFLKDNEINLLAQC